MYTDPRKLRHFTKQLWLEMAERLFARYNPTRPSNAPSWLWYKIVDQYNSDTRHYHDLQHIDMCVGLWRKTEFLFRDESFLALFAIVMHDITYDPLAKDNEVKSSQVAAELWKQMGLPPNSVPIRTIKDYIEATDHKSPLADRTRDVKLILDIDLTSLAVSWSRFMKNSLHIRREFAVVPDSEFFLGRRQVLDAFLTRERIYCTHYFHSRYEQKARANLVRAISLLDEQIALLTPP